MLAVGLQQAIPGCHSACGALLGKFNMRSVTAVSLRSLPSFACRPSSTKKVAEAYQGCPLADLTPSRRGCLLEKVARSLCKQLNPASVVSDPVPGKRCDGGKRALRQSEYDWMCDGRRVQCKSAKLCWYSAQRNWNVSFYNVKFQLLEELLLVVYTPRRLHFLLHDCRSGIVSGGSREATLGCILRYSAPRRISRWAEATSFLLNSMTSSGSTCLLADVSTAHPLVQNACHTFLELEGLQESMAAFQNHPLAGMTPAARGFQIQRLVQEVDQLMYPAAHFRQPEKRKYDWNRDSLRVECKHGRMCWTNHRWRVTFSAVKAHMFDILYLAMDSPAGIYIFQYGGSSWLSSSGRTTQALGHQISVGADRGVWEASMACEIIIDKLVQGGSTHVATICW